jgi:hypothetical protein
MHEYIYIYIYIYIQYTPSILHRKTLACVTLIHTHTHTLQVYTCIEELTAFGAINDQSYFGHLWQPADWIEVFEPVVLFFQQVLRHVCSYNMRARLRHECACVHVYITTTIHKDQRCTCATKHYIQIYQMFTPMIPGP